MTTYYEKRKISIIAVMTRLSSEINPYSRGAKAILHRLLASTEASLEMAKRVVKTFSKKEDISTDFESDSDYSDDDVDALDDES